MLDIYFVIILLRKFIFEVTMQFCTHIDKYILLGENQGCEGANTIPLDKNECQLAMIELNFPNQFYEGSWGHAPPGCFGSDENGGSWDITNTYFNNNPTQSNFEYNHKYRSVCKIGNFKIINKSVLLKKYE